MAKRRVSFIITAKNQGFVKALDQSQRRLKRFGRRMERTGKALTRNISVPVAAAGGLAVKAAADFESSFADIEKTVEATPEQFAKIEDGMRSLAKQVPTSVNELNRLGGVAGQLGIESENIVGFTETLAKLADTTDVVGEQGALKLSRFMNVMGTAQTDIDRLGSTIAGLGNNFAAMESEIVEAATSLSPLGNSIGLTEQQVLSFAGTIAASGGKIRASSTAFQKTANTMKQAVIEGNEDLETFAETADMTASEFQTAFQEDAAGALVSFLEGLRRVQKEGGSVATVLDQVGLADQRLVREFGKVLGNLDDLNRALPMANTFWEENTALTEEARKRYATLNSRTKTLWNNLYDLGITIGNTLVPFVDKLINGTQKLITYISSLNESTLRTGVAIAGMAVAIGPVIWGFGKLIGVISALLSPMAATIALFSGVVVTGQWMVDNWGKIVTLMEGHLLALQQAFTMAAVGIIKTIKAFVNTATQMAPPEFLTGIFGVDISEIAFNFSGVNDLIKDLESNVESTGKAMQKKTKEYFEKPFTSFGESAGNALELAKNTIINGLKGILNSQQIQSLIDQIEQMTSVPAQGEREGSGGDEKNISTASVSTSGIGDLSSDLVGVPERIKNMNEQLDISKIVLGEAANKAKIMGQALQSTVTNAITSFATTLGNVMTGDAGVEGVFNNLLMIVVDFANKFGKLLIAAGVAAVAFKKLIANPVAAIIAGTALVAATTAVKNLLQKGPSGGGSQATSVNDALIRSDGSVINLHPDDDILAMKDFGNLRPAMAGSQVIKNVMQLDGRTVWENQRKVNTNKRR